MKNIVLFLILNLFSFSNPHLEAKKILGFMHQNLNSLSAHAYRLNLAERRLENAYHEGEILISVRNHPLRIRAEIIEPSEGSLVEYDAEKDKSNAIITPKKWLPAIKFKQDINSKIVRRGHYSIHETTLSYFDKMIQEMESMFQEKGIYHKGVHYKGIINEEGIECHKIELTDPLYNIHSYQVGQENNLIEIANNKLIHPYKILELNPEVSSYHSIEKGQIIKIPSSYAKRCVVYIDTEEYLPRKIEVYDELGWFETYTFRDISTKH